MRYLILTYYKKASGKLDEVMTVSKRIKSRDLQTSNIILDFRDQVVVKCFIDGKSMPKDWEAVIGYYYKFYSSVMERLFKENGHELPAEPTVEAT